MKSQTNTRIVYQILVENTDWSGFLTKWKEYDVFFNEDDAKWMLNYLRIVKKKTAKIEKVEYTQI